MFIVVALLAGLLQQGPLTGTLEGTVLRPGSNFPVAGVEIKATSESATTLETVTDGAGRFFFRDVPAGRVAIEARADGYVFPLLLSRDRTLVEATGGRAAILDGNVLPNPVLQFTATLAGGQNLKLPAIPAVPASSIRGSVVDGEGHGLPGVALGFIAELPGATGRPPFGAEVSTAITDEQGEYRRDMLNPGNYYIRATVDRPNTATVTLYYPATTDVRTAAPVVLSEGVETIADIALPAAHDANTFRISGRVTPVPGKSAITSVGILLKTQGPRATVVGDTATDNATGRFELHGVSPGRYDLFASANIDDKEYLGKIPIEVGSRDVEDAEIVLRTGADVKGRLIIEGDSNDVHLARPGGGNVKVSLRRKDGLFGDILKPVIDEAGRTFVFRDVPPGAYDVTVRFVADLDRAPSPSLYVADIRAGGRSLVGNSLDVGTELTDAVEVVVGANGGTLSGGVRGTTPGQSALVLLMPDMLRRSNTSLFGAITLNPDGQFQLRGLAPGIYKIFAVPAGTSLSLSPEFWSAFESRALTVVVQQGIANNGLQVPLLIPAGR